MHQTNARRACRGIVLFINHAICGDILSSAAVEVTYTSFCQQQHVSSKPH